MTDFAAEVEAALGRVFGRTVRIERRSSLGGGSINQTELIETTAGPFVIKSHGAGAGPMFQAEADGLVALGASGTSLAIPKVIHVEAGRRPFLVLEYLNPGPRTKQFDEALGRGLAELHRTSATRFGFDRDNFCGATTQPNPWTDRWVEFYGAWRIGHQLALASDAGLLSGVERAAVERLVMHLGNWIDEPATGPSLIHGDLWSGNLHRDQEGRPALIDPAAYYGHREAELGMMLLFGGFSARVIAAYDEAFALEAGWRDRNPLYQLYHLMNHLNLFGGGYHGDVMATVRRYV